MRKLAAFCLATTVTALSGSAALAAGASPAPSPIALTLAQYVQNFDTLANSGTSNALPAGWQLVESGTGSAADGSYAAGTGSSNAGNGYSFGAAGSIDRALGSLGSSGVQPIYYGAYFTNTTGSTISSLNISYVGEQWRRGSSSEDQLSFSYALGSIALDSATGWTGYSALDFVSPRGGAAGATDGNAINASLSSVITGLAIADGATFAIRWTDVDSGGTDDGLGIDNFGITALTSAGAVPESSTWAMMLIGFGALGFSLRERRARVLA